MARRTEDELADLSARLVYIAGNMTAAETAERLLSEQGIDYAVGLEPFTTTSILGGEYMGLFIYVP